jgi:hypothetical protein
MEKYKEQDKSFNSQAYEAFLEEKIAIKACEKKSIQPIQPINSSKASSKTIFNFNDKIIYILIVMCILTGGFFIFSGIKKKPISNKKTLKKKNK